MKIILVNIILTVLLYNYTFAQQIIASGGDYYQNSNGSVTYTIGEPIIETYSNVSNTLTQGFNQTRLTVTELFTIPESNLIISAYPNPAQEYIIIKTNNNNDLKYELYDTNGRLITNNSLISEETNISLNNLSSAIYFLKIKQLTGKEIKTFKIEK